MNLNQIMNMALRAVMRRAVNTGINAGINGAVNLAKKSRTAQPQRPVHTSQRIDDDGQFHAAGPEAAQRQSEEDRRRAEQRAVREARRASRK